MSSASPPTSTPITIFTGFLGSGKTTIILNLLDQLPSSYRVALLKNEFGDVAIDSQIAASRSIAGVQELLNGCICCNLVGQLGDALEVLRKDVRPDRIIIETSGSAFPATLAMEINRLAAGETNGQAYMLDGVVVVIDVENWKGYEDTSYTAKLQARYTDLVVFNKWEEAGETRWDHCRDRLADLDVDVAFVKSDRGWVPKEALLGLDRRLVGTERFAALDEEETKTRSRHAHHHHHHCDEGRHSENHTSEVEVLSITLRSGKGTATRTHSAHGNAMTEVVDVDKLEQLLKTAPKDEIYRIKAILQADRLPASSDGLGATTSRTTTTTTMTTTDGEEANSSKEADKNSVVSCILNWAFGRWTYLAIPTPGEKKMSLEQQQRQHQQQRQPDGDGDGDGMNESTIYREDPILRMTVVLARDVSEKWTKRIKQNQWIRLKGNHDDDDDDVDGDDDEEGILTVERKR